MRIALAFLVVISWLSAGAPTASTAPVPRRKKSTVIIDTSLGKITVRLYPKKAPVTVANFLRYVDDRFYHGTIIHRAIPRFVIQGGGYMPGFKQKQTRKPIKNEASNGLSNKRGTIAVARAIAADSGTSQFYINLRDNTYLDGNESRPGYCVFGEVIKGMDVVDRIANVSTTSSHGHQNVPREDVVIRSIRRAR